LTPCERKQRYGSPRLAQVTDQRALYAARATMTWLARDPSLRLWM
jgi:hypothetical protein